MAPDDLALGGPTGLGGGGTTMGWVGEPCFTLGQPPQTLDAHALNLARRKHHCRHSSCPPPHVAAQHHNHHLSTCSSIISLFLLITVNHQLTHPTTQSANPKHSPTAPAGSAAALRRWRPAPPPRRRAMRQLPPAALRPAQGRPARAQRRPGTRRLPGNPGGWPGDPHPTEGRGWWGFESGAERVGQGGQGEGLGVQAQKARLLGARRLPGITGGWLETLTLQRGGRQDREGRLGRCREGVRLEVGMARGAIAGGEAARSSETGKQRLCTGTS